jgi:hypothetical protein
VLLVASVVLAAATLATDAPCSVGRSLVVAYERTDLDDALTGDLALAGTGDLPGDDPLNAIDGRDTTAWTGRAGEAQWRLTFLFVRPAHIGLLRAHWGESPTSGVPTDFRWEARRASPDGETCAAPAGNEEAWVRMRGTDPSPALWDKLSARPTRRSWFVDQTACGLRLVIDRTNAGPPVVRELQALESARNVLEGGRASDDGASPGLNAGAAIDGVYETRWAGAPARSRWILRVDLHEPQIIDRVRLVLGFASTGVPRVGGGRRYALTWAPLHYALETSEDGVHFAAVAYEPVRPNGTLLPVRRRLIRLAVPRRIRALRLVMLGATGADGLVEPDAVPVVREVAAFRADDRRPILAAPWVLSVNANPSGQTHGTPGGENANDAYHAKFLQVRLGALWPALRADDRFARSLGARGEWLDAPPSGNAGEALESIEGDDPQLDAQLLAESSPPPIVVLSGSNDWDYAPEIGPDPVVLTHWHWDPLRDAQAGGMGQLAEAVQNRVAPFLGFCGGAQILALLEARGAKKAPEDDLRTIDRVLQRTNGQPIRGFASPTDLERAWPTDAHPKRAKIQFLADDKLFTDLAGFGRRRTSTYALPEWHVDAVRPDAFLHGGPLERLNLVATSTFCAPDVVQDPRDGALRDASGTTGCATVPEVFRSRDPAWPVVGAQFHPEQRDFSSAAAEDPPESVADPRLFLAGAYEEMVDAFVRFAP